MNAKMAFRLSSVSSDARTGEEHPDTLVSMNNLAATLGSKVSFSDGAIQIIGVPPFRRSLFSSSASDEAVT